MKEKLLITGVMVVISMMTAYGQKKGWAKPDFTTVQYAGSIGFMSVGTGYDVFNGKARWSLHYGHVPKDKGGKLNVLTTKFFYVPSSVDISNRVQVNPLDIGLMISYHPGEAFRSRWPSHRYPEKYYWWQTSFRFHLATESAVTINFHEYNFVKSMTAYIEFNTNELYVISYAQNLQGLSFFDIIKVGSGLRLRF